MKSMHALRSAAILVVASLAAAIGSAQTTTWKIDPVHSGVEFRILHLGVSHVSGSFSKVTGMVALDDKEISHSKVEASIDVIFLD